MTLDKDDSKPTEQLIDIGSEIAGSVAATAAGFVGAGPAGALVGAGSGPLLVRTLRWIGRELTERVLSPREQIRVGGALAFATDEIRQRLEHGDQPRIDDFFKEDISPGRSAAEEVLEGTLLAAERSYEEKKLPYIGKLYASIAFDPSVDPPMANYLISLANSLTWNQYVILRVIAQNFSGKVRLRETMFPPGDQQPPVILLAHQIFDLAQRGFLRQHKPDQEHSDIILTAPSIAPQFLKLQGMGFSFHRLARLEDIPADELIPTARLLGSPAST